MAYSAWSVIAGEQPTAAKWNLLGTNDASFNDGTGVSALTIGVTTAVKNSYKFSAYLAANQSISSATWTKVTLNTKEYDTGTNFDAATNYRFTAPISGFYLVSGTVVIGASGLSGTAEGTGGLYKNGVLFKQGLAVQGSGSGTTLPTATITALMQLAANDYIELYAYCSEGGRSLGGGQSSTYMSGFLVSAT